MNLAYLLDRLADAAPSGAAVLLPGGAVRGWGEMAERVQRLAGLLRGHGVGPGDRVAILSVNGPFYMEAGLAAARLGAVIQPMNTRLGAAELRFQVDDAGPKLLLASAALGELAEAAAPDLPKVSLDGGGADGLEALLAEAEPVAEPAAIAGDETFGIFYTSGTTGEPKGVMISHANILANAAFLVPTVGYTADDITLHAAPMFHVSDFCASFAQLLAGGSHAFIPQFSPIAVLEAVQAYRATNMILVPTMIAMLLREPGIGDYDLSSWQFLFYGGSPIPEETLRRCFALLPCELAQGYGQTEATHTICVLTKEDHRRAAEHPALLRSCGRPMMGVHVRVVDEAGRGLPAGEVGEVVVRAPNVMKGYWNRPDETAEALRGGWLHTGDLGVLDAEGYLSLVDRKKDMIITGGENVYSAEVENALAGHPAVAECAVIAVPDETYGERVHAVVVRAAGASASAPAEDLIGHCRQAIAGYKAPRSIDFVDVLPRTAAGKVRKSVLREPYWKGHDRQIR